MKNWQGLLKFVCFIGFVQGFLVVPNKNGPQQRQAAVPETTAISPGLSSKCPINKRANSFLFGAATVDGDQLCDVAVFGGGFGGLYTALAISREAASNGQTIDVALIEPSDQFVFLPLLYDLTIGTATESEVCPYYKDILLGTGVRHIQATFDSYCDDDSKMDLCLANISAVSAGESGEKNNMKLSFKKSVISVGATPQSTLSSVPGALEFCQPFYTQKDAIDTRKLLARLETLESRELTTPRIAIVGGGYGGVELAACVKRKIPNSHVSLLSRGSPMKGTRAEALVNQALDRLGVNVDICEVDAIERAVTKGSDNDKDEKVVIRKKEDVNQESSNDDCKPWDAILWTAGSGPAYPVSKKMNLLSKVKSGRLAIDSTLRCMWKDDEGKGRTSPPVWALGDCTEIVDSNDRPAVPKTAQAAMQQADTVANNVLVDLKGKGTIKSFQYQDLGSMLSLGGPNAALLAPPDDSPLAPLFAPLLDTARVGFGIVDNVFMKLSKSPVAEKVGLTPVVEKLGLSLGGYGLGVDSDTGASPGTLAGTLTGAARRAIYAARMPTNRQRVYAATSAAISTAASLVKEASKEIEEVQKSKGN